MTPPGSRARRTALVLSIVLLVLFPDPPNGSSVFVRALWQSICIEAARAERRQIGRIARYRAESQRRRI